LEIVKLRFLAVGGLSVEGLLARHLFLGD